MRSLSDTIARLGALNGRLPSVATGTAMTEMRDFGSNPGALKAWTHVPAGLAPGAPLVVVLHGCTQNAAAYDRGAGWSQLAEDHGFALLYPEQRRENNANLCFNWFAGGDIARGAGEALSIRQMVARMAADHAIDPARIFVTGLSAGGAMAAVMLATYPDVFAGGAVIAGLPYGSATTMPQAFDRMRGHGTPGEEALATLVRGASDHRGRWPTLSVWQGGGDTTVHPSNADALIGQFRLLHGAAATPTHVDTVAGHRHRTWCAPDGRAVIEDYAIAGMGHGTPLSTRGDDGYGAAGAYMLEAGISSTWHIARFWGLVDAADVVQSPPAIVEKVTPEHTAPAPAAPPVNDVGAVIENALRAAGLLR